jgi:hypothetical protein
MEILDAGGGVQRKRDRRSRLDVGGESRAARENSRKVAFRWRSDQDRRARRLRSRPDRFYPDPGRAATAYRSSSR